MALVLAKNSGINLSKSAGALKKYVFGLSWFVPVKVGRVKSSVTAPLTVLCVS